MKDRRLIRGEIVPKTNAFHFTGNEPFDKIEIVQVSFLFRGFFNKTHYRSGVKKEIMCLQGEKRIYFKEFKMEEVDQKGIEKIIKLK